MSALWPTGSTTQPRLSDSYGPRFGIEGARSFHYGVDIPMREGADVCAAQAGTVIFSGRNGTLGVQVVIRTPAGIEFLYPHMEDGSQIALHTVVKQGQAVGRVGLTGLTTGPHVCFRVFEGAWRSDADARNPVSFMAALNSSTAGDGTPIQGDDMYDADAENRLMAKLDYTLGVIRRESRARWYKNSETGQEMVVKIPDGFLLDIKDSGQIESLKQNGYLLIASEEKPQLVDNVRWGNIRGEVDKHLDRIATAVASRLSK